VSGTITSNFLYSSLTVVLNVAVPLVTYPYIARVLGPENMGRLGIAGSFANYFIAAASLGFATYGVRTIAKSRQRSSREFAGQSTELFVLSLISGALAAAAFYFTIAIVPRYRAELPLFALFGITILTTNASIEWFFRGVEEFRFIGLRNVLLQILSVTLLFIVIRNDGDTLAYAALLSGIAILGASLNLGAARRFVKPAFTAIHPGRHLGPMLVFTLFAFAITAYTNLDFLFLGLASDPLQAGLYTISIRLTRMIVTVTATLSAVLLPRLSHLAGNDEDEFHRILNNSARAIMLFSLPAATGIAATSNDIARFFGGPGFADAAGSLRILALMVPVVACSNFLQLQILVPRGRERQTLLSFGVGIAVTAISMAFLVRPFGHRGAALAMLFGECSVLIFHSLLCLRFERASLPKIEYLPRYLVAALLSAGVAWLPAAFMAPGILRLCLSVTAGVIAYLLYLLVVRDDFLMEVMKKARK